MVSLHAASPVAALRAMASASRVPPCRSDPRASQSGSLSAEQAFREIARLTGGAWCRFDPGAAAQLRELLRAAAAYAAGGREALLRLSKTGAGAARLIGQMK